MEEKERLEKLNNYIDILNDCRYENCVDLKSFDACEGDLDKDEIYKTCLRKVRGQTIKCGDSFIGRDRYLWLEKTVKIPEKQEDYIPVGLFDFGKTGVNNKFGFESLLYVNEKPYQAVDGNHQEVYFDLVAGRKVKLTFLLWSGLEGGGPKKKLKHTINSAKIGLLNLKTDELYYLLKNLSDTLIIIEDKRIKKELNIIIDNTLDLLDNNSISKALNYLKASLKKIKNNRQETIYITGHSHIDVMWLWRLKHTREKIQRTFSTVIKLMNEYPEFKFIQSQPQLYKFLKEDNKILAKQVENKINNKQWEIEGGMWLEADCNIPSGESLVRQFIHGTNYALKEYGKKCEYLWLPDVFGYSYALPQIMKLCDINTFMTTKISWNQVNSMPNDLFYWKGIDGTKILTYFMNTPNNNVRSVKYGKVSNYSAEITPIVVYGAWERFKNKDLSKDLLIAYGYGDGGGGPSRNLIKNAKAIEKIPGLPKIKFAFPSELFKKLHQNVKDKDVPVWDNELYLELHRGTYTTEANSKKTNRKLEYALLENEILASLVSLNGKKYNKKVLDNAWEDLLLCQFHDNLPGSSIKEVYDDTKITYKNIKNNLDELEKENSSYLFNKQKDTYTLYRYADINNDELISIKEKRNGYFLDEEGNVLDSQKENDKYLIKTSLKPYKPTLIRFIEGKLNNKTIKTFDLKHKTIETPFYKIKWNKKGFLSSIFDKENNKEVLDGQGNILRAYVNRPKEHDAWDIDIEYLDKYDDVKFDEVNIKEEGLLRSVIEFKYHFNDSIITQDLIVYKDNRRIDFKTHVSWHEDHRLLRSLFELNIDSKKANYDIQFGHLERNTHWNNSWDKAKFEVCAHKWMDYSDKQYGISLLNDCKYGYSAINKTIGITLLNSPKFPNPYADMGEHDFTYSLLPHKNKLGLSTIDEAILLNEPTKVYKGKTNDLRSILIKNNDAVKIDAFKKAEDNDGYILHLHEVLGKKTKFKIESDYAIKKYCECNLLEENKRIIKDNKIEMEIKPFEIKAFRIWFS